MLSECRLSARSYARSSGYSRGSRSSQKEFTVWWATDKPHERTAVHRVRGTDETREEKAKGAGKELLQLERAGEDRRSARTRHLNQISENAEDLPGAEGMERARAWTAQARAWELWRAGLSPSTREGGEGRPAERWPRRSVTVGGVPSCRLSHPSGVTSFPLEGRVLCLESPGADCPA